MQQAFHVDTSVLCELAYLWALRKAHPVHGARRGWRAAASHESLGDQSDAADPPWPPEPPAPLPSAATFLAVTPSRPRQLLCLYSSCVFWIWAVFADNLVIATAA
mgnify:CR=1 FL=1